ncbi:pancreatic polypeptide prohormone isoform X1 [Tamandua tetradactyla]|uniref:pancreatic polypeptide prohormone isoform X1 n=1 Tax=Tamandua tetradactyla TaxID=48850 RepID=UPI004053FF9C
MAATRRCLSLLLLCTYMALLLQPLLGSLVAPLEPIYPEENATAEQLAQYAAEIRRYINMLSRPRCMGSETKRTCGTSWSGYPAMQLLPGSSAPWTCNAPSCQLRLPGWRGTALRIHLWPKPILCSALAK